MKILGNKTMNPSPVFQPYLLEEPTCNQAAHDIGLGIPHVDNRVLECDLIQDRAFDSLPLSSIIDSDVNCATDPTVAVEQ